MPVYDHRQTGYATAIVGGLVGIWIVVVAAVSDGDLLVKVLMAILIAAVVAMFTTLRTRVDRTTVHSAFTFGFPRRSIPVDQIIEHHPVRNTWYYGWGVRLVPGGTLFSVWGLDAVAVTYRKGPKTKTLRIGTDDVAGLDAAITTACRARG